MKMPWTKKSERMEQVEKEMEEHSAQLEAFNEALANAKKGIDDLFSELIRIKKDGRNGDH